MFLDDTACNLASLNLMQFRDADKNFDVAAFSHATRLWTIVLEDLGHDGAVPFAPDCRAVLPVPHAGSGLRQYWRAADVFGPVL
jgi:hypothetical protein